MPTIPDMFLIPPVKIMPSPLKTTTDALPKSLNVPANLSLNGAHSFLTARYKPTSSHLYDLPDATDLISNS